MNDVVGTSGPEGFRRVGPRQEGYDVDAVREALAAPPTSVDQVRALRFPPECGGFDPEDVDHWLARREDALAVREQSELLQRWGREEWLRRREASVELVMGRLQRSEGERFRAPEGPKVLGYFTRDVDAFCDRLLELFRQEDHLEPGLVRQAVFRQAHSTRSYDEAQVDAFMDEVLDLVHALSLSSGVDVSAVGSRRKSW